MNCSRFRRDLPDWLRGDLNETVVTEMKAHTASCRPCAREEAVERHLRSAWKQLPKPAAMREQWPRVAAALETPAPRFQIGWARARLAVASVFAAGALCALAISNIPAGAPIDETPNGVLTAQEEQQVIQMVSQLRQIPDLDAERNALGPPLRHEAALLGTSDGR